MNCEWAGPVRTGGRALRILAASSAMMIWVGACGRPECSALPEGTTEERPREEAVVTDTKTCVGHPVIGDLLRLPVDVAAIQITALVDPAVSHARFDKYDRFDSVIDALVECSQLPLLEAVAAQLPIGPPGAIPRRRLFHAMRRWDRVEEFRPTLERLALRYPEEWNLAPFRPGGMEYLFVTLEDPYESPNVRAYVAMVLAAHATEEMIARLEPLTGDKAIMEPSMGSPGVPASTVGDRVRHAIRTIRRRFHDSGPK